MDRVGSGVWGNDTGVSNEAVDDGSEIGTGGWGLNEAASVSAVPTMFAAEGERLSATKQLGVGCMPKNTEGGGLDGADMC